jgi:hypothetical protein
MICEHCKQEIQRSDPWGIVSIFHDAPGIVDTLKKLPYGFPAAICWRPQCAVAALGLKLKPALSVVRSTT